MLWFEKLTGFTEESPQQVRANLAVTGQILKSKVNQKEWICGELAIPSLAELRDNVRRLSIRSARLSVREVCADVKDLHADSTNAGSVFQVASQFNLLEMVSPSATPEHGVGVYEYDRTQGPVCAIAAGAGTIYRNYFAKVNGQIGQTYDNQIDCLASIGVALGNADGRVWEMKNGYALTSRDGLIEIDRRLRALTPDELDDLRGLLRIGIQWNTQVTFQESRHTVSQAYCSALPVSYSHLPSELWEKFARLVLEACYEATICAAVLNWSNSGNRKLFLTLVGGGAFGNHISWIIDALHRALGLYKHVGLDVLIVSHGASNRCVRRLIDR